MKVLRTLETLGWALLDVSDVLVGEVFGDACIADSMVEHVAWVCKSLSNRHGQVDLDHVPVVPLAEPTTQVLLDLAVLEGVPQRNGLPKDRCTMSVFVPHAVRTGTLLTRCL